MSSRLQSAEWLEWSGLPGELNSIRNYGWVVFKKLVELDCRWNRTPAAVEVSLGELGDRIGLEWEKVSKIIEALQKKKYLACFLPDNPDEPGLFQIRTPIKTPKNPEQVATESTDPNMRDPTVFRYVYESEALKPDVEKIQKVIDLYLNQLSQKLNSFIVDEIEVICHRFEFEDIRLAIDRAAKHEIQSIGWVAKELIRDKSGKGEKKKSK